MSVIQATDMAEATTPESRFLVYCFSAEDHASKSIRHQSTDLIDVLAMANYVGIRCLPIIWQTAQASVGLGGTSTIRQAPLDAQTELAFKLVKDEEKVFGNKGDLFHLVWNEIRILGHPQLRAHKNIIDLLGICWDVAGEDSVWPALVFEKSHFGDLHHFTNLPRWMDLTPTDKLKICVDIGNALSLMHGHRITHGDLKPHNILIFKANDSFVAKVTDFGYSRQYSTSVDSYSLPLSEPWGAPEVDGSDKKFSWEQAKQADIYSYALLCAWVLYGHRFQEVDARNSSDLALSSEEKASPNSVDLLQQFKNTGQLQAMVLSFINSDEISPEHREELKGFFYNALASEPSAKNEILWNVFKLLERPNLDFDLLSAEGDAPANEFKLGTAIEQYYQCNFHVRSHIAKCLRQRVDSGSKSTRTMNDVVQLAVCYHIGFGVPRDESKCQHLCASYNITERFNAAITALDITPMKSDHPLLRRILAEGNLGNLHQIGQKQDVASIQAAEKVLVRELNDVGNSINSFVLKYLITRELVDCYRLQGRLDLVEKLESQMLEFYETTLGMDNLAIITGKTNLAHVHWRLGKLDIALRGMEQALQASLRMLGPYDTLTLAIMGNVAAVYDRLGDFDQAEKIESELQEKRSASLGKDHPDTLTSIANRAVILWRQGKLDDALPLAEQAYKARRKLFGNDHPDIVTSSSNLALIYQGLERYDEAERLLMRSIDISERIEGKDTPGTLMSMANLALNHWHKDKLQEAEDLGLNVVARRRDVLGAGHPDTLTSIANLALVYESQGRLEEALDLESQVLEKSRETLGDSHPDTLMSIDNLANTYRNMQEWTKAETLMVEALSTRKRVLGETHPDTMADTHKLLLVLLELGKENEMREIAEHLANLDS